MMKILNHEMWKNANIEMIGQNGNSYTGKVKPINKMKRFWTWSPNT